MSDFSIYDLRTKNMVGVKMPHDRNVYDVLAVDGVNLTVILWRSYYETLPFDKIKPLKITDKRIMECGLGFEVHQYNDDVFHTKPFGRRRIRYSSIEGVSIYRTDTSSKWFLPHIKYIHQLQNLMTDLNVNEQRDEK
jgi:hypothetical protein